MKFQKNMGTTDRIVRTLVALILGYLAYTGAVTGVWQLVAGGAAFVLITTSIFAFCPPYVLLGIKTCTRDVAPNQEGTLR